MKIALSIPERAVVEPGEQIPLRPEPHGDVARMATVLEARDGMMVLDIPEDWLGQHVSLNVGGSFSLAEVIKPREIKCASCDKVKLGFFEPWECIECQ